MADKYTRAKRVTYRTLRARLIERGTNFKRFAEERGLPASSVYEAAKGLRHGIKAVKIKKELEALAA